MSEDVSNTQVAAFIAKWQGKDGSERSNFQLFVTELCELLAIEKPTPAAQDHAENAYVFERHVKEAQGDGSDANRFIDCYRRGAFVMEGKKLRQGTHTKGYGEGLLAARAQGERYARALPATEGRPPFVIVVDVGEVIELYAEFTRSGGTYTPYPDPRSHRLPLSSLAQPQVRQMLRSIWLDPLALDPSRISAEVTRDVAAQLAELARSLEADGHSSDHVAAFLTRALFCMFAEDVELLPKNSFRDLLAKHQDEPATLGQMLRVLWMDMDHGGFSPALARQVLRFNGKIFKGHAHEHYVLPLTTGHIRQLLRAAQANWQSVEPAIFGTLLERALNPAERHALGAHYTPRAYVERLVLPTVIQPLRAQWADAQAAALLLAREAHALRHPLDAKGQPRAPKRKEELDADKKLKEACAEVKRFHHHLCTLRVLDPACGSGNFLYVTLEHLKRLEGEVLNQLYDLGESQNKLGLEGETVTPRQLLGIEINQRAAALAELVLWIGHLQWHIRTQGNTSVSEPVVHDFGNIECRDAVLAYSGQEPALNEHGQLLTRWDGKTHKTHPATGEPVPDEAAQVPQWRYLNPQPAAWPQADYIVGNPPFIGASTMRAALGDGYVEALRHTWKAVPDSADFVMYWWHHAVQALQAGQVQRFGFITTNSLRQTFNRRVLEGPLADAKAPVHLAFAIADHPWVDSANGAAVRIAMTVAAPGTQAGRLLEVTQEAVGEHDEIQVTLAEREGHLHADLRLGANVASAKPLAANADLSNRGVQLFGAGFIVTRDEAAGLGLGTLPGLEKHIREYRNGRDLTAEPRDALVIDAFGLTAEELRNRFPTIYQWIHDRVKPERDAKGQTKDGAGYAKYWWMFGKPRQVMRQQLHGLPRYIATVETAKHRTFQFLDANVLPDNKLVVIALGDACHLGVLSSFIHGTWAVQAGSHLGVGNDPVYVKTRCFETFPFPSDDTGLTPDLAQRIRTTAEQIDAHRKRQQQAHAAVTLTGMYNVLEKLRQGQALNAKEKVLHEQGLVSVLQTLHDELDALVLQAYGWQDLGPVPWADAAAHQAWTDNLLERLVQLNTRRAQEEAQGAVRWLRPAFQDPAQRQAATQTAMPMPEQTHATDGDASIEGEANPVATTGAPAKAGSTAASARVPWPPGLPEQMRAVADALAQHPSGLSEDQLAERFTGRGPWRKRLPQILDTLVALGRARTGTGQVAGGGSYWQQG